MNAAQGYIAIAIIILLVICLLLSRRNKNAEYKGLSTLAAVAFGFVLAGIIFGENRAVGYSLMGIGVVLAVIDIYIKHKDK